MTAWYKEFYNTTASGEADLREAIRLDESGDVRADLQKRLLELKELQDDRCHISTDQRRFLERVLGSL